MRAAFFISVLMVCYAFGGKLPNGVLAGILTALFAFMDVIDLLKDIES